MRGSEWDPFLKMGEIFEAFQEEGIDILCSDLVNKRKRGTAIVLEHDLRRSGWMESGPMLPADFSDERNWIVSERVKSTLEIVDAET